MAEIGTFSVLIDEAVKVSGRGLARQPDIIGFSRATMRECEVGHLFYKSMREDQLTVNTAGPFIWDRPSGFRIFRTVKYPSSLTGGEPIWPKFIAPGKKQNGIVHFYYGASTYFTFSGVDSGALIDIAYYSFQKSLAYYTENARPAKFDDELGWLYLDTINGGYTPTLGDAVAEEAARNAVTNWLILDWYQLILEGAVAKTFKIVGELDRARSSFALFKSQQNDLYKGEVSESFNV